VSAPDATSGTHLWPVTAFRVRLQIRSQSVLDPFERLILELSDLGHRDPESIADMTGLDANFVRSIVDTLKNAGNLGDDRCVTEKGRRGLEDKSEPQVVAGWMLRDDLTGTPLASFMRRLDRWPGGAPTLSGDRQRPLRASDNAGWMTGFINWRRRQRPTGTAADAALESVDSLSIVGDGIHAWLPVDLVVAEDGRGVQVTSRWDVVPEELEARLAHVRPQPSALTKLQERAADRRRELDAIQAENAFVETVEKRLAERSAGRSLPADPLHELHQSEKIFHLVERDQLAPATLLAQFRKLAESIANSLSPQSLDVLERPLRSLPKRKASSSFHCELETLAAPDVLTLPREIAQVLDSLRDFKKVPNYGQLVFAWPFVAAVLAPKAKTTDTLRAAVRRCPGLWTEFEALGKACNPSAHFGHRGSRDEINRVFSMVVRILDAAFPASGSRLPDPVAPISADYAPSEWRTLLLEAADAEARSTQDPLAAEAAVKTYREISLLFLDELSPPVMAGHRAAMASLPPETRERMKELRRRMDGLVAPDDDGRGFELQDEMDEPLRCIATHLEGQGLTTLSRAVWPLVAAALVPGETVGERLRACLTADRDLWKSFTQVSSASKDLRSHQATDQRIRLVALARSGVERLLTVRSTALNN
jgi:hypothetical protein